MELPIVKTVSTDKSGIALNSSESLQGPEQSNQGTKIKGDFKDLLSDEIELANPLTETSDSLQQKSTNGKELPDDLEVADQQQPAIDPATTAVVELVALSKQEPEAVDNDVFNSTSSFEGTSNIEVGMTNLPTQKIINNVTRNLDLTKTSAEETQNLSSSSQPVGTEVTQPLVNEERATKIRDRYLVSGDKHVSETITEARNEQVTTEAAVIQTADGAVRHLQKAVSLTDGVTLTKSTDIKIAETIGQPDWQKAFSERIVWLSNQQMKGASIHLNPPELGPLEVKLRIEDKQASIAISAEHAVVRDAIEGSLSQLKDMFKEQGINLQYVDVSDKSTPQQNHHSQGFSENPYNQEQSQLSNDAEVTTPVRSVTKQGLVDYFA